MFKISAFSVEGSERRGDRHRLPGGAWPLQLELNTHHPMHHPATSKKVQGGSPEGTLAWVRQKGCFGADEKVVLRQISPFSAATGLPLDHACLRPHMPAYQVLPIHVPIYITDMGSDTRRTKGAPSQQAWLCRRADVCSFAGVKTKRFRHGGHILQAARRAVSVCKPSRNGHRNGQLSRMIAPPCRAIRVSLLTRRAIAQSLRPLSSFLTLSPRPHMFRRMTCLPFSPCRRARTCSGG